MIFILTIGGDRYEIRHRRGFVTGCTRQSIGVHLDPGELWALAARHECTAALSTALHWAAIDEQADRAVTGGDDGEPDEESGEVAA